MAVSGKNRNSKRALSGSSTQKARGQPYFPASLFARLWKGASTIDDKNLSYDNGYWADHHVHDVDYLSWAFRLHELRDVLVEQGAFGRTVATRVDLFRCGEKTLALYVFASKDICTSVWFDPLAIQFYIRHSFFHRYTGLRHLITSFASLPATNGRTDCCEGGLGGALLTRSKSIFC